MPLLTTLFTASLLFFGVSIRNAQAQAQAQMPLANSNPPLWQNCSSLSLLASAPLSGGDVSLSPYTVSSSNAFPKLNQVNSSTWELWYFDTVTTTVPSDGAITISFFHDGSAPGMGKSSLRTSVVAVFADGDQFATELFADEVQAEDCPLNGVHTTWTSGGGSHSSGFDIAADLGSATLRFDTDTVKGTIEFVVDDKNRYRDVLKETSEAERTLAPTIYWLQSMPRATVSVEMKLKDKALTFTGVGGYDRFWTPFSWSMLMEESIFSRHAVGPYTLVFLRVVSKIDQNVAYPLISLFENGELVFRTQNGAVSLEDDFLSFQRSYFDGVVGKFKDRNTGYVFDLVQPKQGRHWRFETRHELSWWNFPTGEGTGNSGFVEFVRGGEVGGEVFEGVGSAGQCILAGDMR